MYHKFVCFCDSTRTWIFSSICLSRQQHCQNDPCSRKSAKHLLYNAVLCWYIWWCHFVKKNYKLVMGMQKIKCLARLLRLGNWELNGYSVVNGCWKWPGIVRLPACPKSRVTDHNNITFRNVMLGKTWQLPLKHYGPADIQSVRLMHGHRLKIYNSFDKIAFLSSTWKQ